MFFTVQGAMLTLFSFILFIFYFHFNVKEWIRNRDKQKKNGIENVYQEENIIIEFTYKCDAL